MKPQIEVTVVFIDPIYPKETIFADSVHVSDTGFLVCKVGGLVMSINTRQILVYTMKQRKDT